MKNCKFITNRENAPSWNPRMDFDHDIAIARNHIFLSVFPKVAVGKDNQCAIVLDCFGLRYKHMDKFEINILDGECLNVESALLHLGNLTGHEMYRRFIIPVTSETGTIQITDTFETYDLNWKIALDHILVSHKNYQVLVDFEQGVVNIPNREFDERMVDFLNLCKSRTTDPEEIEALDRKINKHTQRNNLN